MTTTRDIVGDVEDESDLANEGQERESSQRKNGDSKKVAKQREKLELAKEDDKIEVLAVLAEMESKGGTIEVRLKRPGSTQYSQVETNIPANEYSLVGVVEKYGGGEYQIRGRDTGGKLVKSALFSVDARKKGSIDQPKEDQGLNRELFGLVKDGLQRQGGDIMPMVTLMVESMKSQAAMQQTLLTAVLTRKEEPRGKSEMVEFLGALVPLLVPVVTSLCQKDRGSGLSEQLGVVKQIMDIAKGGEGSSGEEEEKGLFGTLKKLAEPLAAGVTTAFLNRGLPPIPEPALPTAPSPTQIQAPQPEPDVNVVHRYFFNLILQAAAQAPADPTARAALVEEWAGKIETMISTDQWERQLKPVLQSPNWRQQLFPGLADANAANWLDELRQALLSPPVNAEQA